MNDQRKLLAAAVALCVQQGMQPSEESIKKIIPQLQQLRPEQIEQLAGQGEQLIQKMQENKQQNTRVAALGTKLEYINKLKGICPEGTEKVYLAKGGCMCKKKVKSAEPGGTVPQKQTKMPTKYNEKIHERLADGEAMGKNNKAQQDSLQHYRKLYNKKSDLEKYNMGDQEAGLKLKSKKSCGGLVKRHN